MADYLDISKIVSEGYSAGKAVSEDIASKDILQQAYAGQTPEEIKDPIKQAATLNQAAGMLQSKGLASAAYKLQKQAGDLSTDVNKQQLDTIKVKQGELEYAGQLLQSAGDDSQLQNVINETVKDPAARMSVESIMRNPNMDFAAKKKALIDMTMTADQHLKAQTLAMNTAYKAVMLNKATAAEIETERKGAWDQLSKGGVESLTARQKAIVFPTTAEGGEGTAPVSVRQNNPLNLTDPKTGEIRSFKTYEEGAAAGKADLASKLDGSSDAYKRRFGDKPVTPERLAETWSPAAAKGNTPEATANYAKEIAKAAEVSVNEKIPNTPEVRDKLFNTMSSFEAGPAYAQKPSAEEPVVEPRIKQEVVRINSQSTKKDKLSISEANTVFNQVDKKYWDTLDTPESVRKVGGTIGTIREAQNISDFIKNNKVSTGYWGEMARKLDSMNPNQSAASLADDKSFGVNEQKLSKLVLDFANQYARSERGGTTPMATVAELKAAMTTFGVGSMSPASASQAFQYIADHQKEKLAYDRFNGDVNAIKPRAYADSGKADLSNKAAADIPTYTPEIYKKLEKGQQYKDPDGNLRTKG
jgi:hypothetical protein